MNAPQSKDVSELRAFLGLLNYYGKFLPNLAGKLHPLNSLLQKQARWVRSGACEQAFVSVSLVGHPNYQMTPPNLFGHTIMS